MNKKLIIVLSLVVLSVLPATVLAAIPPQPQLPNQVTNLWTVIVGILGFLWPIFVGIAMIMFMIAGFIFLTANGDPNKVKTARDAMIWGTVGMIVGLLSFSLPWIIGNQLGL